MLLLLLFQSLKHYFYIQLKYLAKRLSVIELEQWLMEYRSLEQVSVNNLLEVSEDKALLRGRMTL